MKSVISIHVHTRLLMMASYWIVGTAPLWQIDRNEAAILRHWPFWPLPKGKVSEESCPRTQQQRHSKLLVWWDQNWFFFPTSMLNVISEWHCIYHSEHTLLTVTTWWLQHHIFIGRRLEKVIPGIWLKNALVHKLWNQHLIYLVNYALVYIGRLVCLFCFLDLISHFWDFWSSFFPPKCFLGLRLCSSKLLPRLTKTLYPSE